MHRTFPEAMPSMKLFTQCRRLAQTRSAPGRALGVQSTTPQISRIIRASTRAGAYKALERLLDDGKVRAIGVSNFTPEHLDALLQQIEIGAYILAIQTLSAELVEFVDRDT